MPTYERLDPISELEQRVAADLAAALEPRGAKVTHYGTASRNAPGSAPSDITVDWGRGAKRARLLVEVTQQLREAEFGAVVTHLDNAVAADPGASVNLLYASPRTSNRLSRLFRNENQRRADAGIRGRIIHLRFRDLEAFLVQWRTAPSAAFPLGGLTTAFGRWKDYVTDVAGALSFQSAALPTWTAKAAELDQEQQRDVTRRQEQLKRDIERLENRLRERGVTGERAQKALVYLFFIAIYEDKRGPASRATLEGFRKYREQVPLGDVADTAFGYRDRTIHHLMDKQIRHDRVLAGSGMFEQYEALPLPDAFVESEVLPIFEKYPLSDAGVDFIGAVFEAMARRAEKDNRIGQFFTPETAVQATCRLVALKPDDVVLDPACGTGRFLIRGMNVMLSQAAAVGELSKEDVEQKIREDRLLGTEITPWVAAIAKMNMYLHGDGKSNVKAANGLTLSVTDAFAPRQPARATNAVSVVLMNPPLGDLDFLDVGRDLARLGLLPGSADAHSLTDAEIERLTVEWSRRHMHAVEHIASEETERTRLNRSIDELESARDVAVAAQEGRKADGLKRRLIRARATLAEVERRILAGELSFAPRGGSKVKGGALFLSVVRDYLKEVRLPDAPEEWRGGMAGVVIDESLLNTSTYAYTRAFIRRHFFIKAVVSLPRDAFAFLAKTTAKTSIIVLVRKPRIEVVQREPVFYARAEDIGYTPTGLSERNDLPSICDAFDAWRDAAQASWTTSLVDETHMTSARTVAQSANNGIIMVDLPEQQGARLDYAAQRMQLELQEIEPGYVLADYIESVVVNPDEVDEGQERRFASASGIDGRVRFKGATTTKYKARDLRQLVTGDILVSGIDLIRGAVGVVPPTCDGMVVSKEYFVFQVRDDQREAVLPEYIAAVLRSHSMRSIVEGTITGVSNRTRVENPEILLGLPINPPPPIEHQRKMSSLLRNAYDARDRAADDIQSLQDRIATGQI